MTITANLFRNLSSLMFTVPDAEGFDLIDANGTLCHSFPSLELPLNEHAMTLQEAEEGFKRLFKVMTPSKADIALAAKGERHALSLAAIDALATSNRPDSIPSDLRIMRVTDWEPEKRVFIPLPAPKDASLSAIVKANTKPDGFMMNVPMRPVGNVLGEIDATAWRKGEASSIRVHTPGVLPAYQHPQREMTQGELMAMAWLADPKREKRPATRSSRMARLAARFWDKGDGHSGIQPVMPENAAHRALGRINRAIRFNANVAVAS